MASLKERLRRLEARRGLDRERRICPECGAQNGGPLIWETHHRDGNVTYNPREPCSGCDEIGSELYPGEIRRISIKVLKPEDYPPGHSYREKGTTM
jgi:hypothetical protein